VIKGVAESSIFAMKDYDIDLGSDFYGRWNSDEGFKHSEDTPTRFMIFHPSKGQDGTPEGGLCVGAVDVIGQSAWWWNGNRDKPTFKPSIACSCGAHGYVTDGVWSEA
jgi:hypothetical protein